MQAAAAKLVLLRSLCALLGLLACASALALPADRTLAQLYHTQWTVQDGAPQGIEAITQSLDGYIWLSAGGRLFRFDGVEFEHVDRIGDSPLPKEKIYAIWARPQGGLWVSYLYGGATFIGDGWIDHYSVREGLPPNTVTSFAQDGMGEMWAGTTRGLVRLEAGAWKFATDAWNIPATLIETLHVDREGTLWALTGQGLFYLRRGSRRFESGPAFRRQAGTSLISSAQGVVYLTRAEHGITELRTPEADQPLETNWRRRGFESKDGGSALIDRDGNLWVGAWGSVSRVRLDPDAAARAGPMGEPVRLVSEWVGPMLEDREGNIWITSNGGIDKFRTPVFARTLLPRSFNPALAAAADGSVWIGTAGGSLHRLANGVEVESMRMPVAVVDSLHVDRQGTLWLGDGGNSLWHLRQGQWIQWRPHPNDVLGVQAIASEAGGALWVSIVRSGVYRVVDNQWTLWGGRSALPAEPATTLAFDGNGRLWLGYVNSRLAVIDREHVMIYDAQDGLMTGSVQVTAVRGKNIWVGGERGLSWFDGRRFHSIEGVGGHAFVGVNGVVEQAHGDVWLNTGEGAVHIPAAEVRMFVQDPTRAVRFRLLNYLDGMPGAPSTLRPIPTAAESADGRIWFASTNGVVSLVPGQLPSNPIVPNVFVKSLTVDGRRYDPKASGNAPLQLPTNPRDLQISYTALSFTIPERVKFRYQLEGANIGWQDVGARREAYFTELPPGQYRFQVLASNDAGLWNETGAAVEFVIPPTFFQSSAFAALCVASASATLWLLFLLRMRQVKAQLQSRSEERLLERERIARELHDTFLQGVHGLMLRFQTATERIPEGEPARQLMEDALERADRVLAEGRDKVSELRASRCVDLPEALSIVGTELARDYAVRFDAKIEGAPRELSSIVHDEAYRIGAEALANAFHHARATHVSAHVQFGRRYFSVRVVDDGAGFDASNDSKAGRWGLKGMRERAERIRGRLTVSSKPGAGASVELLVPARLAYVKQTGGRWRWLARLAGSKQEEPA